VRTWWHDHFVEPGKVPLLLCFLAFIITFLTTRTITRLIRAGRGPFKDNVRSGGLHVHHAVPGVVLLVPGAILAISAPPDVPWREISACLIGVGASLVLDEFALILHLQDVYWSDEGRVSVQVVMLVTVCLACVLLGLSPFGVDDVSPQEHGYRTAVASTVVMTLVTVVLCVLKGKYRLALLSVFVLPVAWVGAVRLARPGSPWFTHRYANKPDRQARALARAKAFDGRWGSWFSDVEDFVAGRPSPTV